MMTRNKELFYWQKQSEWYHCDEDGNVTISEDAPPRAKKSFEEWKNHQEKWSDESSF